MCASAAVMILLQAGDVRQATSSTSFLVHEIRRYTSPLGEERTSEVVDEVKELQRLTVMIVKLLSERCGKPEATVKRLFERKEVWQSATEALEWGLIDKIIAEGERG
jgi:ATP-dependent protease ClpP protease subunit